MHAKQVQLIVNADDYGLTEGVSRGILRAHHAGIVTSTSVLAVAPAFEISKSWLADAPRLGVGVHLCLCGEDPPLSDPSTIRTLVDRSGRFPATWSAFLFRAASGRIDPEHVQRELGAQIERVLECGANVTHVDSHQHLHLWPVVAEVALRLSTKFGIEAIRVPRSTGRRWAGSGVNGLANRLARAADRAGLAYPGAAAGFDEAGGMSLPVLLDTLERLSTCGASSAEIGVHPGESDDPARARYRWNYEWADELAALMDPQAKRAVQKLGFELVNFGALSAARGALATNPASGLVRTAASPAARLHG